jgi:hypothetical protein
VRERRYIVKVATQKGPTGLDSSENPIRDVLEVGTESFLRFWYGEPSEPVVEEAGPEPEALRDWWAYERAWSPPLTRQNRVLSQAELIHEDDHVVFYVENQGVVLWSYAGAGDAEVFERNSGETLWRPVGACVSTFLLQVAVFEASFGPNAVLAGQVGESELRGLLDGFDELPLDTWAGCRLWATDVLIANVVVNQPPDDSITEDTTWLAMFSARELDDLEDFASRHTTSWDYDSGVD